VSITAAESGPTARGSLGSTEVDGKVTLEVIPLVLASKLLRSTLRDERLRVDGQVHDAVRRPIHQPSAAPTVGVHQAKGTENGRNQRSYRKSVVMSASLMSLRFV
jgi:hypothetical protein